MNDELETPDKVVEYSVEALSEIKAECFTKGKTNWFSCVRLPNQIRQPLICELEEHITSFITSEGIWGDRSFISIMYVQYHLLFNTSKVSLRPLSVLVKEHFVPICSLCIAVHCSMRPDKEVGGMALNNSILQFAEISELERDELIKKHMVSIVSFLLSLSSCSVDPELPFFTKETVVFAVRTVVDGFLDIDDHPITAGVVDKINIFRADRIFMFLLEMHYQLASAVHSRHIRHRLTSIEVLTRIIGHRATNPSSSYYIISIVGQFIGNLPLQEQCCVILSTLLKAFKAKSTREDLDVLGEQLQFLVSKLVACCIPSETQKEEVVPHPSRVIALLYELTVEADPLLLDHIRELEPFPHVDCLEKIRMFHNDLCRDYSARDHFLKFAKRAYYLPKGLLFWGLRNLHKKLLLGEIIKEKPNDAEKLSERNCWDDDPDVVSAIWVLVDLCSSNEANAMSGLLADFISRAGIGDPCCVVFHLPNASNESHSFLSSNFICLKEKNLYSHSEVSDVLLIYLLRLLKKFLADDSVEIVDITSRTLKVIPFTPSAGVLEWVDRTIPLGEYLLGSARNGGAHGRYGVGDWSFLQCREYMMNEKDKRKAFLKVCDNFRPVMHYFFLEKFLQPADWFQSRLSYTRSVAASSMVGYIVGLGDRHSMNILIDQETAEVVHIDLGVAFEQGLMLKTPERVPFRLTRDIIDGMGVTGIEGVFRRCCEETLSVMRTNKEALLTIIEVFIHDPLYKWALSPLKALQRQKEIDDGVDACWESSQDAYEGNKDAARATLRIKEKLDGYEAGEIRSVRGQVQQVIQDAIDTDRLCHMFPGWAAWL